MSDCSNDCSSCSASCGDRQQQPTLAPANPHSNVKRMIGVVSGKGGVGKSTITASLAVAAARMGKKVGILDADITGPSIPAAFGVHGTIFADEDGIQPAVTTGGIKMVSLNLMTANETDPVVWRGPVVGGVVRQFWSEVVWGDLDCLFVDMPPGTSDVALTVFQSLPISGIIVVTTPQDLVSMIMTKAVRMAEMMSIPILGLVENYSYFTCDECGKQHSIFGESKLDQVAADLALAVLARLPIDPALAAAVDAGAIETADAHYLDDVAKTLF